MQCTRGFPLLPVSVPLTPMRGLALKRFTHSYLLMVNDYVSRWLESRVRRGGRLLLYGRRKTGKTTLAKRTLRDWRYIYVGRDRMFYDVEEDTKFSWPQFRALLRKENKIIIDEFHRAPEDLFAYIHAGEGPEDLVLITSTLNYFKRFVEGDAAPLLGLFTPIEVPLLKPSELLAHFRPRTKVEFEKILFYQEPWAIGKGVEDIVSGALDFSTSLVHTAFTEEGITIGERYFHILQAIAIGKTRPSEISSYLFSHNLLPKDNPALIMKYLSNLVKTGFLHKIEVFGTKKHVYRHVSPVTQIAFYLNGKYAFYEVGKPLSFGIKVLREQVPRLVEQFVGGILADVFGGRPAKCNDPEVDVLLLSFRRPSVVAEVKWREKISKEDVARAERKLSAFDAEHRILVVPDADNVPETTLEIWDIERMVKTASSLRPRNIR